MRMLINFTHVDVALCILLSLLAGNSYAEPVANNAITIGQNTADDSVPFANTDEKLTYHLSTNDYRFC